MSHNLMQTKTKDGLHTHFVFSKRPDIPWHRLGQEIPKPVTAHEALRLIQGDFVVEKVPNYIDKGNEWIPSGSFSIIKPDTFDIFANAVTETYTLYQYQDAADDFNTMLDGKPLVTTAGLLGNGEKMFMSAFLAEAKVQGLDGFLDVVNHFAVQETGHDGKTGTRRRLTIIEAVCQNTLTLGELKAILKQLLRHDKSIRIKSKLLAEAFQMTGVMAEDATQALDLIAQAPLGGRGRKPVEDQIESYGRILFPFKGPESETPKATLRKREELHQSYAEAPCCGDHQPDSGYKLFGAATWWQKHFRCNDRWAQDEFQGTSQEFRDAAYKGAVLVAGVLS